MTDEFRNGILTLHTRQFGTVAKWLKDSSVGVMKNR